MFELPEPTILTLPEIVATPREAFLAPHETVPLDAAAGRIAGQVVALYPPESRRSLPASASPARSSTSSNTRTRAASP